MGDNKGGVFLILSANLLTLSGYLVSVFFQPGVKME
jgi:hypothetical protein